MTGLDTWLHDATRHLSDDSAAQVRIEIQEHYESAREAAMASGATEEEAGRSALRSLGDAKAANCQYREVLLTATEAKMLRQGNSEARFLCALPAKWLILVIPAAIVCTSIALYLTGAGALARTLLLIGTATGFLFATPFLPIYTPSRSRAFRMLKWAMLLGAFAFTFGSSWLYLSSLWPLIWIEWTRVSIRRKLPVAQWPKQLYL